LPIKPAMYIFAPLYIFRVVLLLLNAHPRQAHRRPIPRFYVAGTGGVRTVETCINKHGRKRTAYDSNSSEGYVESVPIKPVICISVPLFIRRVVLVLLNAYPRQAHRRPIPRFYVAGAGGVRTVESCISMAANARPSTRIRRRNIAAMFTMKVCQ